MKTFKKTKYVSLTALVGATSILLSSQSYAIDPAKTHDNISKSDTSAPDMAEMPGDLDAEAVQNPHNVQGNVAPSNARIEANKANVSDKKLNNGTTRENNRDNTEVNARDDQGNTLTPMDQSNDKADLEVTAAIRKQLTSSNELSTYAQNIKIITTKDHKVTLRGPVRSRSEVESIDRIAKSAAGNYQVVNELEVKPEA